VEAKRFMLAIQDKIRNLSETLPKLLGGTVSDLQLFTGPSAHEMYTGIFTQPGELPLPIMVKTYRGMRRAEKAMHEAKALLALRKAGFPAPSLYYSTGSDEPLGEPFLVQERLPGTPLGALVLAKPDQIDLWIERVAVLMIRLHALSWEEHFYDFRVDVSAIEFAERQVRWWAQQAESVKAARLREGFAWLRNNAYRTRYASRMSVVHGDFHPNNVMAHNNRIVGVLDWGELIVADPAIDVGWSRMVLTTEVSAELGDTFAEAYTRISPGVIESLHFWEVFAACKRLTSMIVRRERGSTGPLLVRPDVEEATYHFIEAGLTDDE
jgi:aminoglycoside phosphotransferase (APT) family kinase protein